MITKDGLEVTVKITDLDLFKDIVHYLKKLNDENPELRISEHIDELYEKHKTE